MTTRKDDMGKITLKCGDCLELMRELPDNSIDIIFTDPPYALGSDIVIKPYGKPDYSKAVDFMNKWDMPTGEFWEAWFKEALRVLKYGGHCLVFGMDRQNFMFKYYGHLAGFTGKQSLYWYFISNFPKASDLSKMIDKNAGAEREVVGKQEMFGTARKVKGKGGHGGKTAGVGAEYEETTIDITAPSTPLAKKYDGYKYSVAPLKQVVEEIMVFQKPMKTGSVLHDVLAMENGDDSITCGALDIDGNRVGTSDNTKRATSGWQANGYVGGELIKNYGIENQQDRELGRYPAQAFLTGTEDILGDTSKILHKCPYEETDLFIYSPKVSKKERNEGCEGLEDKIGGGMCGTEDQSLLTGSGNIRNNIMKNNHPTVKPQKLLTHILKLFKSPDKQVCLDAFMGSGSTGMACKTVGFDFIGIEKNAEYFEIAKNRIESVLL